MSILRQFVKKSFGLFNLEIISKKNLQAINSRLSRMTMDGCLVQASRNGLNPTTIIDVGAASGTYSLYTTFPDAYHILIEPLEEFATTLKQLAENLKHSQYFIAAATSYSGEIILNVHPDLFGSSIYKEDEESNVNGVERIVPAITLDEICNKLKTHGSYLIKIDTQGSELDVLKGAQNILKETELVILEVSLFKFFDGGPQLHDCIDFMKQEGFVAYEVFDPQYRLLDGAMSQVDIAFVPENSQLRKFHFYANKEQRQEQNEKMINGLFE